MTNLLLLALVGLSAAALDIDIDSPGKGRSCDAATDLDFAANHS